MNVKEEMNCFTKDEQPNDSLIVQYSSITQQCLKNEPSTCDIDVPCLCEECTGNGCKEGKEINESLKINLNDQIETASNLNTALDLPADHIASFFDDDEEDCHEQLTSTASTSKPLHQCPICEKELSSLSYVSTHMRLHSNSKPFSCSVCGKAYTSKGVMKLHESTHVPTQSRPQCTDCGARFTQVCSLKRHQHDYCPERRKVNAIRPFVCSLCGKAFAVVNSLKIHQVVHSGEKPFNCSICGINFNLKGNLEKHEFLHSSWRPFNCTMCGKGFVLKSRWKAHQMKYSSKERKVCSDCGASFCRVADLNKHQRENCRLRAKKPTPPESTQTPSESTQTLPDLVESIHFQVSEQVNHPLNEADWSFPLGPCRFDPASLPPSSTWELFQKYSPL